MKHNSDDILISSHSSYWKFNVITACLLLLISSGCSLIGPPNLFESGRYHLEVDSVQGCTLEASSSERDGKLFVDGHMTFKHHPDFKHLPAAPLSGDVQAQIFGAKGNLLQDKTVPFKAFPHGRHIHPAAQFQFVFDNIPPAGSLIKLSHRLRPFDGNLDDPVIR